MTPECETMLNDKETKSKPKKFCGVCLKKRRLDRMKYLYQTKKGIMV